jgi:rsbT co-antagonist protein RsbR
MSIVTAWRPVYWLGGTLNALTAGISLATAVLLPWRVVPTIMAIPTKGQRTRARRRLRRALREARLANAALEAQAIELRAAKEEAERVTAAAEEIAEKIGAANIELEQARSEAVKDRAELQAALDTVGRQDKAIRALSTPVLDLGRGLFLMPLIGDVDSQRAEQLMATMLDAVAHQGAKVVILDLKGVTVVDSQVAVYLRDCVLAARLMGGATVITGIRPDVASTCIKLGVDFNGIATEGSLQDGIRVAMMARKT